MIIMVRLAKRATCGSMASSSSASCVLFLLFVPRRSQLQHCNGDEVWRRARTRGELKITKHAAISSMELLALQLEGNTDYPVVDHLYEKCNAAIETLRSIQHNPHISGSLENLLETLSFQKSLLASQPQDLHRTQSDGLLKYSSCNKTADESIPQQVNKYLEVEDMLLPPTGSGETLDDVIGHEEAKQILREAVMMPVEYPQLFQGGAKPWRRLLLYGPPGTGKTRLARALASHLKCPFYCVSSASLLSSWTGESEKLIQGLFQHARRQSGQTVIFIDEIDALCRKRSQQEDDHSRRVKSELLQQMEGIDEDLSSSVFLMGATNCPWDMDSAFLRRFQRRIYAPLPGREARRAIISKQFSAEPLQLTDSDWLTLLEATEGYSGADLTHLATTAAFQPIRDLQSARFWRFTADSKITPCSSETLGAMQYSLSKLPSHRVVARDVDLQDFMMALLSTPRTVSTDDVQRYQAFSGSTPQG